MGTAMVLDSGQKSPEVFGHRPKGGNIFPLGSDDTPGNGFLVNIQTTAALAENVHPWSCLLVFVGFFGKIGWCSR